MALRDLVVRSYKDAVEILNGRTERKVANNTCAQRISAEAIAFKLHHTDIVIWYSDGVCKLNSGGYRTVTTKDRMNRLTPVGCHIYQERNQWYVKTPAAEDFFTEEVRIHPNGVLEHNPDNWELVAAANDKGGT